MSAPTALEHEEERRMRREQKMREYNLWDDPVKSNELLAKVADSAKVVDGLKDLAYKVIFNWHLFKLIILVDGLHFHY